jgi:ribosome recycling factor
LEQKLKFNNMNEEVTLCLTIVEEKMLESINHLELSLLKIRAGRANTSILEGVQVDYYGTPTLINNMASLSTPDARTIVIQPWEKKLIPEMVNAVNVSNLGFLAQDNGEKIIINIPALTEDRRKDLVKQAKIEIENCKVSIRNARRDGNDDLKKLNKDGLSDDDMKFSSEFIQQKTNDFISKVDLMFEMKEKDILTV